MNNEEISKEEKLAAAKKRLKEFKKNSKDTVNKTSVNNNNDFSLKNELVSIIQESAANPYNNNHYFNNSSRSSPSSSYGMTQSQINDLDKHNNHDYLDIINKNSSKSVDLSASNEGLSSNYYEQKYKNDMRMFQEQLQLHLQTIGILVAEKTELQSTLQQTVKKIDKKQEEIDELSGRLKASRQKISDLEKFINESSSSSLRSEERMKENEGVIDDIKVQLNSSLLTNDELKIRLNDINEKFNEKSSENKKLMNEIQDLKSELEISELRRVQQLNNPSTAVNNNNDQQQQPQESFLSNENIEYINSLNEKLFEYDRYANDLKTELESSYQQKLSLQTEYQVYTENLQKQIENLVDQINKMTDEREDAFRRIDDKEKIIMELKKENEKNIELNNNKPQQVDTTAGLNDLKTKVMIDERRQQLECEVQYFKQQIEILLLENNHLNGMIVEKDGTLEQMKKLHTQINDEKQNYEKLLDAMQSEKSALSRAIQQNKELKDQLSVLEDAYIKLTNTNADLLNQVQAERHLNKQLNVAISLKDNEINSLKIENNSSENAKVKNAIQLIENKTSSSSIDQDQDWGDVNEEESEEVKNENTSSSPFSKTSEERTREIERISNSYNELINTLNDKDLLINQLNNELNELKDKINSINFDKETLTALLTKTEELKFKEEINSLNSKLIVMELERSKLVEINEKLNSVNNEEEKVGNEEGDNPIYSQKNIKLLEYKFTKVMQENVDLKEKNQQLEHIVMQLQFENDTIVDYISMYQVEREKLAQKYRMKDETIRKLHTQLQVNKFAIKELNDYFNQYSSNHINQTAERDEGKDALFNQINDIIVKISDNEDSQELITNQNDNENKLNDIMVGDLNNKKFVPLRSVIICGSCQGDLFNI